NHAEVPATSYVNIVPKRGIFMSAFTEKAITDTFIKLLNKKPLDKITVKDLVDECGINRSTFYYYFEDIYDLLNHVFETETRRALEQLTEQENWSNATITAISFALENKRAIYHIYNSVSRERLEKYLYNIVEGVMTSAVNLVSRGLNVSAEDKAIAVDVYKFMLVGLVLDWVEKGMKSDAKQTLDRIFLMLDGNLRRMLERVSKPQPQ
ncbi:MAG: TetR/AcrR family transcriptional regulator, partial [Acutalibacteraceae bacterium]